MPIILHILHVVMHINMHNMHILLQLFIAPSSPTAPHTGQLAARGTKQHVLSDDCFLAGAKNILKTMMFHDVATVLNERKHLQMVTRSVPDSVSLILG